MLTQPAGAEGRAPLNAVMFRCCVSSGKLNVLLWQGEGHGPVVVRFSSSSQKVRLTVVSMSLQPPVLPVVSKLLSRLVRLFAEARQTEKLEVRPALDALIQRAAYLRPSGSRWSPHPPASQ